MNNNLTEIIFVLDRSGSMADLTAETIGGFNSLIDQYKEECVGDVYVSTVLFDNQYELLMDRVNVKDIKPLTNKEYFARGSTALLDAVGRTIDSVGERLSATPDKDRPGKVILVITTDGYENSSHIYSKKKVKEMITRQEKTYNWNFLFLGADIDAAGEAAEIGINSNCAVREERSAKGVSRQFGLISKISMRAMSCPNMDFGDICAEEVERSISED